MDYEDGFIKMLKNFKTHKCKHQYCKNCPLDKEVIPKETICDLLEIISRSLKDEED